MLINLQPDGGRARGQGLVDKGKRPYKKKPRKPQ